jgi:hypothetical protein
MSAACFVTRPRDTEDVTESYHEQDEAGLLCQSADHYQITANCCVHSHVTASCSHSNSMYELQFVST